jgi:hypothetical protein
MVAIAARSLTRMERRMTAHEVEQRDNGRAFGLAYARTYGLASAVRSASVNHDADARDFARGVNDALLMLATDTNGRVAALVRDAQHGALPHAL